MAEPRLSEHAAAKAVEMFPGIVRRTLSHGERTSLHELHIAKGAVVPAHTHPHEQIGYLASGRILFEMPGLRRELGPGDSWIVPSGVEHKVTGIEDAVGIDIFSPVRTEYLD